MQSLFPGIHAAPNLHPLVVHFPIALWLTALVLWIAATVRGRDQLFAAGRWLLWLGTAGGALAVGTGYRAAEQMGHDTAGHDLVHVHRDYMLVAAVVAAVTAIAAFVVRRRTDRLTRWLLVAALGAASLVTVVGADRGALLVFGYGMGSAHLSPPPSDHHQHGEHGEHEQQPAASNAATAEPSEAPGSPAAAMSRDPRRGAPAEAAAAPAATAKPHAHAHGEGHAHGHAHDE